MTESASRDPAAPPEPDHWPDLGLLVRHIVETHHRYVRQAVPEITVGLHHLVNVHGPTHPSLHRVRQMFARLGEELRTHMEKEEHILFPYITELAGASARTGPFPPSPFGTVANPVRMMEDDHQDALGLIADLRELTEGYTPPLEWSSDDAACYAALARFEADLRRHIQLEDTVLFPGALDLEERLT